MVFSTRNKNKDHIKKTSILIKLVRKNFKYSQKEFSSLMNISQGFLSKIENSLCSPDIIFWLQFCSQFDIDPLCILKEEAFIFTHKNLLKEY